MAEQLTHFYEKFQPTHYNIYLDINRQDKQFSGTSTITGDAKEQSISIHQKFLDIQSVQLDGQDLSFTRDDKQEAIHINLPKTGEVKLVIAFQAKLTDTMMGIYPSYYEVDGVKNRSLEPSSRRRQPVKRFHVLMNPKPKRLLTWPSNSMSTRANQSSVICPKSELKTAFTILTRQ